MDIMDHLTCLPEGHTRERERGDSYDADGLRRREDNADGKNEEDEAMKQGVEVLAASAVCGCQVQRAGCGPRRV